MAQSSVMVSLPQMVDLALHSPEVGAVNFNILHALLHVIIQQVDLLECKVELKGDRSEVVQNLIANSKPGPAVNVTEYIVTPGKEQRRVLTKISKYKKIKKKGDPSKKASKEEILVERELKVIEQRKDSKEEPLPNPSPITSATELVEAGSLHTVVVVETAEGVEHPHTSVALSKAHFEDMENEIHKLKDEIKALRDLPANMGLIEALRNASVDKSSPVLDMFQILNLTKRVDATETAVNKLASMLEDLAKDQTLSHGQKSSDAQFDGKGTGEIPSDLKERLQNLEDRLRSLEDNIIKELTEKVEKIGGSKGEGDAPPEERLTDLETKLTEYTNQIATIDKLFTTEINVLQTQFTELEKEIGEIVERINAGFPAGDFGADQNIADLYSKIMGMKEEMETVTNTAAKLLEEREERQLCIDAMVEQIELLKTIKADREDLEDALADKADACVVNRKVSHDQFDAACDDLSRGIEDALCKLTQQEQLWQQALDDIQREIENKLDKMELTPLRDFIHNKIKVLQERLKALAALKKETEAAGTKSKFLRNVQCISCDKDVVMRKQMDPTLMPPPASLPPTKSMGPYLAYELDALRKQQKSAPHSRNMHHFESAMSGVKGKGDDHICNRYCGGSHTVTTPQQRVTRLGHFLQQWGPEMQPLSEGEIRGTDGQLYKSREPDKSAAKHQSEDLEESESYYASTKSRPSIVVQGSILANRSNLKSAGSNVEGPQRLSGTKAGEQDPTSARKTSAEARVSVGSAKRSSKTASKTSQQRASQSSGKEAKQHSRISFKDVEPPAEDVAEVAAEAATGDGDGEAPAPEAPAATEGADEGSPAEGEAEAAVPEAEPPEAEAAPPAEGEEQAPEDSPPPLTEE